MRLSRRYWPSLEQTTKVLGVNGTGASYRPGLMLGRVLQEPASYGPVAPPCFRTLKSLTSGIQLEARKRIYLLQNIAFTAVYIAPAKPAGLGELGNTLLSWAAPAGHRSTAQNQKVYLQWVLAISVTLGRCRDLTQLRLLLRAARLQHTKN